MACFSLSLQTGDVIRKKKKKRTGEGEKEKKTEKKVKKKKKIIFDQMFCPETYNWGLHEASIMQVTWL